MSAITSAHDELQALVPRAARGNRRALASLYRALAPSVLGYLRGQGAREPEDLTSEVFCDVIRGLPRFRGDEAGLRAWIFTIAHRRLTDERRRGYRRPVEPVDPLELEIAPTGDPEEEALARLEAAALLKEVAGLTPDQRDVILLRFVADLPVAGVARILGKTEGAVKTLTRRAMANLEPDDRGEISAQAVS